MPRDVARAGLAGRRRGRGRKRSPWHRAAAARLQPWPELRLCHLLEQNEMMPTEAGTLAAGPEFPPTGSSPDKTGVQGSEFDGHPCLWCGSCRGGNRPPRQSPRESNRFSSFVKPSRSIFRPHSGWPKLAPATTAPPPHRDRFRSYPVFRHSRRQRPPPPLHRDLAKSFPSSASAHTQVEQRKGAASAPDGREVRWSNSARARPQRSFLFVRGAMLHCTFRINPPKIRFDIAVETTVVIKWLSGGGQRA